LFPCVPLVNGVCVRCRIGICCFFAKQAAFKRNVKDCLARNQVSLSEWSDMFARGLLFQRPSTIKIKLILEEGTLTITPLVRFSFVKNLLVIFITINTVNTYRDKLCMLLSKWICVVFVCLSCKWGVCPLSCNVKYKIILVDVITKNKHDMCIMAG
jgi:hypothetical protein